MLKILYIIFLSLIVTNCSVKKVVKHHGVPFLEKKQKSLIINKTNKNDIKKRGRQVTLLNWSINNRYLQYWRCCLLVLPWLLSAAIILWLPMYGLSLFLGSVWMINAEWEMSLAYDIGIFVERTSFHQLTNIAAIQQDDCMPVLHNQALINL